MAAARPNFLFLFPDQHRWDWLGLLGQVPVRTPNLDRLAQRGVLFRQCRTNSPVCAPARACLASGLRRYRIGVLDNGMALPANQPTFFRDLKGAGYRVLASGKTDLYKHGFSKKIDGRTPEVLALGFSDTVNQCGKWDAINTGWPVPDDPYMAYLHQEKLAETHVLDYRRRNQMRRPPQNIIDTASSPLPRHATLQGSAADASHRQVQVSELGDWRMVTDGRYKLITAPEKPAVLYDLQNDPAEITDVAGMHFEELARLTTHLAREFSAPGFGVPAPD